MHTFLRMSVSLIFISVGFGKPCSKRNRFMSRVEMGYITDLKSTEICDAFLPLLCNDLSYRRRCQRQAVPEHKRRYAPQMRHQHTAHAKMTEKCKRLVTFPLHTVVRTISTTYPYCSSSLSNSPVTLSYVSTRSELQLISVVLHFF